MAKPEHKQFKVGDVVMLKSGGFPMTVTRATNHEGTVAAGWFAYQNHVHRLDRQITKLLKETKDQLAKDDYEGYQQAEKLAQQVLDEDPTNYAAEA